MKRFRDEWIFLKLQGISNPKDESMLCHAHTRLGKLCQKHAMNNPTGRCRLHGGLSLSGHQHPNYRHGKRSKAYIENAKIVRAELKLFEQLGNEYGWFKE